LGPYTVYVSHYVVAALYPDLVDDWRKVFRHELNKRNAGKSLVREVEVDGPRGTVVRSKVCTLVRINTLDAPNWTRPAWALVADRDYLMREAPLGTLPHRETQFGRLVCGVEQNEKTLAAGFIVNAWQLFRDMIELDRSQTGFDLLYAYERHPDPYGKVDFKTIAGDRGPEPKPPAPRKWPGGEFAGAPGWPAGNYPAGAFDWIPKADTDAYERERKAWLQRPAKGAAIIPAKAIGVKDAGKGKADFPATLDDFLARWGGAELTKGGDYKAILYDRAVGGIALSHGDDPAGGSVVAAGGTRGVILVETADGFAAYTADSFKAVDGNDPLENFLNLAKRRPKLDGGEALGSAFLGWQAEFLFGADFKIVAVANTNLAKHLEAKSSDPEYPEVRIGYCHSCHAASDGYMSYVEQFKANKEMGLKFNVYPEDEPRVRDFFLSWDRRVRRWREPYADYLAITTADAKTGKPWSGAETWSQVRRWRNLYDQPLTLRGAAAEFGMTVESMRWTILQKTEKQGPPQARLNALALDGKVPRPTWENNTARDMALWWDLVAPKADPIKDAVYDQIIEDAKRRFGYGGGK
jgi:hypothetical protein